VIPKHAHYYSRKFAVKNIKGRLCTDEETGFERITDPKRAGRLRYSILVPGAMGWVTLMISGKLIEAYRQSDDPFLVHDREDADRLAQEGLQFAVRQFVLIQEEKGCRVRVDREGEPMNNHVPHDAFLISKDNPLAQFAGGHTHDGVWEVDESPKRRGKDPHHFELEARVRPAATEMDRVIEAVLTMPTLASIEHRVGALEQENATLKAKNAEQNDMLQKLLAQNSVLASAVSSTMPLLQESGVGGRPTAVAEAKMDLGPQEGYV
jgi:hypothetical protein